MKDLNTIIFDIGSVLLHLEVPRAVAHLARLTGHHPKEVESALFEQGFKEAVETGRISKEAFWRAVTGCLGTDLGLERFAQAYCDMFTEVKGMPELVAELAEHYPLYLLSNTDPFHFEYIKDRFFFVGLFNGVVTSYDAGAKKPAPEIYHTMLRRFGLKASCCLFIDDLSKNVLAARKLGFEALPFTGLIDLRRELAARNLL